MKNLSTSLLSFLVGSILNVQPVLAEKKVKGLPGGHMQITEIFVVEGDPDTLTIFGQDFDFGGGELVVTLGEEGELTIVSDTASEIEVKIPDLPAGDYLVSVFRQGGQSQGDEYDLTIVAASELRKADGPCFDDSNRYVDCNNGSVTDTVTGLIWLKDANCEELSGLFPATSLGFYAAANQAANLLEHGTCGLQDNSVAGDWRLPTKGEWEAMVFQALVLNCTNPALTDSTGTACYASGPVFIDVQPFQHWSSSSYQPSPSQAWNMSLGIGSIGFIAKTSNLFVWPVRGHSN